MTGNSVILLCTMQEWHRLLVAVKSTVEGILASQAVNVWNTYGGLERLSKNIQHILSHDLKVPQGHSYNDVDFWPFVRALRWIDSAKWRAMESNRPGVSMARVWLRQSLLNLNLSSQLVSLVSHSEHLHHHYKAEKWFRSCDLMSYIAQSLIAKSGIEKEKLQYKFQQ